MSDDDASAQSKKRAHELVSGADYFAHRASPLVAAMPHDDDASLLHLNDNLTEILLELGQNERAMGNLIKYNAYVKAANAIKLSKHKIASGADAQRLDGVGKKIGLKIDEIIATGQLQKLEAARADPKLIALNLLQTVHGVGPVTAKAWFAQGITTLDELRAAVAAGTIKLTHEQSIGLHYVDAFAEKIPRAEMDQHAALVLAAAARVDATLSCEIVGSYRRGAPQSGDIDCLLMHDSYGRAEQQSKSHKSPFVRRLVDELVRVGYVVETLNHGQSKFSGVCRLSAPGSAARKLDIKIFPREAFAFALLHFTGSGFWNKECRAVALSKRLTLSEFGLQAVGLTGEKGAWIELGSERAILELLGIPWREPHERNL